MLQNNKASIWNSDQVRENYSVWGYEIGLDMEIHGVDKREIYTYTQD